VFANERFGQADNIDDDGSFHGFDLPQRRGDTEKNNRLCVLISRRQLTVR
jgi:hypothetical protein